VKLFKVIFISPDEPRLRAGWRLLVQFILWVVFTACILLPFVFFPDLFAAGKGLLIYQVVEGFGILLSIFLARRFLDKRSFSSLGLTIERRALVDIGAGISITFLMMVLVFGVEYTAGWLVIDGYAWGSDPLGTIALETAITFLAFILVGVNEELLSRGYHLQNLASGLNMNWAVVISSAVFGGLHFNNPNANWVSALGIFFAGVFLAYGYLQTRQLWLPIGLHIGWNFFEGAVFGFPVSGMGTYRLIQTTVTGPKHWTGGLFGPEAGLVVIPALLLGAFLVNLYTRNRVLDPDSLKDNKSVLEIDLRQP